MVMVVMVVSTVRMMLHMAVFIMAVLTLRFQFQRCVPDAVFPQLFAHPFLDLVRVPVDHDMHRCVIALPVHAPDVNVMNVQYAFYVANMLLDFMEIYVAGRFFKKEL